MAHWIAISGSWRHYNAEVERDVRREVAAIMAQGGGIVTGGALGVDYLATSEALKYDPGAERIRVIIPTSLETFTEHYHKRAAEGVIAKEQAHALVSFLSGIKQRNPEALIEMEHETLDEKSYYDRNTKILDYAVALKAFQVNGSLGTQDAINKAHHRGMVAVIKRYTI